MDLNWPLFMHGILLLVSHSVSEANADECIEQELYANALTKCCRMEEFTTEAVAVKCYNELSKKISPNTNDFIACYIECIYLGMGFLTEDNQPVLKKYNVFVKGFDIAYQRVASFAFATCAQMQETIRNDVQNTGTACSAFALLFHVCVAQLTMKNCPSDRWTKHDVCDKLKSGMAPCE